MSESSMSLLKAVLNYTDQEDSSIQFENLQQLQIKGNEMIIQFINTNIIEKPTISNTSAELLNESEQLSEKMENILYHVCSETKKKLQNSSNKLQSLLASLYEDNYTKDFLDKLIIIDDLLTECKTFQNKGLFMEMNMHLDRIELIFYENLCMQELVLFPRIFTHKKFLQSKFTFDFSELLESVCSYEMSTNSTLLKIKNFDGETLMRLIKMSDINEEINHLFCTFAHKLYIEILKPLILHSCILTVGDKSFKIVYDTNKKNDDYHIVLKHLKEAFQFLSLHFINKWNLLIPFGEITSEAFCEILIHECLNKTIPIKSVDFQNFQNVLEEIDQFNSFLESIEYMPNNNQVLLNFIKNINQHFSDKSSAYHLTYGRDLIKTDIQDLIDIYTPDIIEKIAERVDDSPQELLKSNVKLNNSLFKVDNLKISKSIYKLVEFINDLLMEGKTSNLCARKNFLLTRDLIELFLNIGEQYHRKFLDSIPQQSAIFYNNCNYLVVQLFPICYEYQQILEYGTWSLGDLFLKLKEKGDEVLIKYLKKEQNHILNYLRNSGLTVLGSEARWEPNVDKAVLQCLRMMKLLHSVWKDILPPNIYDKSLGILLGTLIDELIYRIKDVEDMPAEIAKHLVKILNVIKNGAFGIFMNCESLSFYVKNWQKFCLLIEILNASLKEIENKWHAKDSGLSKYFRPEEIKQLIRALFQNTERRAFVLARIQ